MTGRTHRRTLGGTTVTVLSDGALQLSNAMLLGIDPADAAALRGMVADGPPPPTAVNAVLVQSGGRMVLVDAGGGTVYPTLGGLADSLAAAGVQPNDIDAVLMTHLHGDHWGGLVTSAGAAAFPRAELLIPAAEAAYWLDAAAVAAATDDAKSRFAGAQAAVAPYKDRLRTFEDGMPVPGLQAVPLPGHTPGHTGYMVEDGGERLLIWGDVMHIPAVQAPRPDACMVFDVDPAAAGTARRRVLAMAADQDMLVAGMHLDGPAVFRVRTDGAGYTLVPA